MAEAEKNEVALSQGGNVMASFMDFGDMGGGFEGTDKDSYAIPFIQILQKMSPLVDEDNSAYVEGAKAGMLFNTVTRQLFDGKKGILIIPCAYRRSYILWGGRGGNGGFKGEFTLEEMEEIRQDATRCVEYEGRLYVPDAEGKVDKENSDYYADTRSHFVIVLDPETGNYSQAIISLASSLIKASKSLMTSLSQQKVKTPKGLMTPPSYANVVRMTTVAMSNEKGNWSGANFSIESLVTDADIYAVAREFNKSIVAGSVNVDYSKADAASAQGAGTSDKPQDAEGF